VKRVVVPLTKVGTLWIIRFQITMCHIATL
jgi:hypothetical protein